MKLLHLNLRGERKKMKKQYVTPEKWEMVNPESKRLLKEFMLTLRQESRSKKTLEAYNGSCRRFLVYVLENLDNKCITEIRKKEFKNYSLFLQERGLADASHNNYIIAVRSWCERLEDDEDIQYDNNLCRKVKGLKIKRVRKPTFLTDEQVTKLYYELMRTEQYQIATWLALAYDSTGRRMEIFQATKEGFLDESRNCTNPVMKKGKNNPEPLVYFERTKEAARLWMKQRGEDGNPSLWSDFGKRKRTPGTANSWCNYMSKVLSLLEGKKIRFTPHDIRHSAIENLTEATHYKCPVKRVAYDIKAVSKLASHASTDMTEYYKKDKGIKSIESAFGVSLEG
jgi:integrase/recombinase XerD